MDATQRYSHLIGKVIDERYEILQVKGIGGMAVVLKAKDLLKNRIVAIKMLNEKNSNDNTAIRRFVNESRAIALLSSEHIVDIYDVAFTGRSKYIVMEYIDGITLREYMKRNAPLGIDQAIDFSMQILSALQHAHEKGVVHRDIKPQNIMVQTNGKLKVTDFGIAQISDTKNSNAGVAMGTVYYISPEQASGKTTTFSSDLYSAGVMLYEMATGKLPFEGDTPLSIAMMQVNSKPIRPRKIEPKIPQGLEQIILRAMNKAPENRFRSAKSMYRALEIIKKDKTVVFEEASRTSSATATPPKSEKPSAAVGASPAGKAEEKEPKREGRRRPKHTLFPVVLGVSSAFLLVLAFTGVMLLSSLLQMTKDENSLTVTIPSLIGTEMSETVQADLEENNISLKIQYVNSDDYEKGQVVSQDPAPGQTRKIADEHRKVPLTVQVSLGKRNFVLPDFSNQEYREVQISLTEMGARVEVQKQYDFTVINGYIIATSPPRGTVIENGDKVTLYVSMGVEIKYANMIDVTEKELSQAKRLLLNANFIVGDVRRIFSDTVPEGHVISQSIEPGVSTAQKYTPVDLVVSLGPGPNAQPNGN